MSKEEKPLNLVWDQDVAGSNPVAPTISQIGFLLPLPVETESGECFPDSFEMTSRTIPPLSVVDADYEREFGVIESRNMEANSGDRQAERLLKTLVCLLTARSLTFGLA